jgi:arylsulfatase
MRWASGTTSPQCGRIARRPFSYRRPGLDHYCGFVAADSDHYHPPLWDDQARSIRGAASPDYYLTTDLADRAIQWITTQKAAAQDRLFCVLGHGCRAFAASLRCAAIAKYRGCLTWADKAREPILANQKELNVVLHARLAGAPGRVAFMGQPVCRRAENGGAADGNLCRRTELADREFGRNRYTLKKTGQYENTIVVVLDNGASGEGGPEGTFNETYFNGSPAASR